MNRGLKNKSAQVSFLKELTLGNEVLSDKLAQVFKGNRNEVVEHVVRNCQKKTVLLLDNRDPLNHFFEWMIKSEDKLLGGEKVNDLKDCPQVKRLHFKKDIHGKFKGQLSQNNSLSIKKFLNLMLASHYTVNDLEDLIFQASGSLLLVDFWTPHPPSKVCETILCNTYVIYKCVKLI